MGLLDVQLEGHDERYAPAEGPVLRLTVVAGVLFVAIGKRTEEGNDIVFKDTAGMGVDLADAADAINALARADARASALSSKGDS